MNHCLRSCFTNQPSHWRLSTHMQTQSNANTNKYKENISLMELPRMQSDSLTCWVCVCAYDMHMLTLIHECLITFVYKVQFISGWSGFMFPPYCWFITDVIGFCLMQWAIKQIKLLSWWISLRICFSLDYLPLWQTNNVSYRFNSFITKGMSHIEQQEIIEIFWEVQKTEQNGEKINKKETNKWH